MIETFSISNFRGFRKLDLRPLQRVNLFSGTNNVGKTAILEAIFLHLGPNNPQLILSIDSFRGVLNVPANPEQMSAWLFHDRRLSDHIELTSTDTMGAQRSLIIRLAHAQTIRVPRGKRSVQKQEPVGTSTTTAFSQRELRYEYHDAQGKRHTSRIAATQDPPGIQMTGAHIDALPIGIFISTKARSAAEDAERFSNLQSVGNEDSVVRVLQRLDDRLRRLAVLVTNGQPNIHADVGISRLIPVSYLGEGFSRLLSIVLAIMHATNGTVLIDEVENGLHHSTLPEVWRAIEIAARDANSQVFATTHSWECIEAAHAAFQSSNTYDFRLHRLEREAEDVRAFSYDQEMLSAALDVGLETR